LLILSVIGLSLAGRKVRGGMGLHLAMGIGIGALFVFVSKFSVTFASLPGVAPMFGVWIPNLIFSFVALFLASRAQR
jgi:lipopolysaccharide export system permease protein